MRIRYLVSFLAGGFSFLMIERGLETFLNRVGMFGGEILILPMMITLFLMGMGYQKDQKEA